MLTYYLKNLFFFSESVRNPLIGRPASFDVDTSGAGLGELAIQCRGPSGNVPVDVRPTAPGRYNVSFIPNKPGEYNIHFVFNGDDIPGSPIKTIVNDPNKIVAHGEGLYQVRMPAMAFHKCFTNNSKQLLSVSICDVERIYCACALTMIRGSF